MPELSSLIESMHEQNPAAKLPEASRIELTERAAGSDPNSHVHAFELAELTPHPLPEAVSSLFPESPGELRSLDELIERMVTEASRADFDASLTRAIEFGGSRVALASGQSVGSRRWWTILDLSETYDLLIVIIGSEQQTDEIENLVPRQCRMQTDEASVILEVDDACLAMLGYSRQELIGKPSLQLVHEDDHESAIVSWIQMLDAPGKSLRTKLRYIRANGEIFWAEVTYRNSLAETGRIDREILDVDEQVDAEMAAGDMDRVIRGLADVLPSGVAQIDPKLNLVFANDRWREILGLTDPTAHEVYQSVLYEPSVTDLLSIVADSMRATGVYDGEITISPGDGADFRRCRLATRLLRDNDGRTSGYVACLDDITDSWRLQQRLVDQATRDQLTGLLNRNAALQHLDAALERARALATSTAVIFLDLNEFKRVNDVLGHAAGDQLLREVSSGIARTIRSQDVVARHGGDEFLVICEDVDGPGEAVQIAHRLLDAVTGRYRIDGTIIDASGSCGLTVDHGGRQTGERMIAEADLAMYEQKRNRSHEPRLFQPSMFEEQREELNRDSALARAVDDDSLVLHYQPIVDLATRAEVGYEALLRWKFEDQLVYPDQFIGLAERRGLISGIGAWVVDAVCRQAASSGLPDTTWSLNVSPIQLRDPSFDAIVAKALDRHGIEPARLSLELTENVVVSDDEPTAVLLHRLSDMGVNLIIDDFGTGFASLDYLRTFPLHGLKLDRCFSADIERARTQTIVAQMVQLVEALDVDLVVEGIETEAQADIVALTGAAKGQGYLFGRPAPLADAHEATASSAAASTAAV